MSTAWVPFKVENLSVRDLPVFLFTTEDPGCETHTLVCVSVCVYDDESHFFSPPPPRHPLCSDGPVSAAGALPIDWYVNQVGLGLK